MKGKRVEKKILSWGSSQRKNPCQDPHKAEGGDPMRDLFNYRACDISFIAYYRRSNDHINV